MKGLYSNEELIDTMIVDANDAVKALATGQYIYFCKLMYDLVVRLGNLKKNIHDDMEDRNATIETLKRQLKEFGVTVETKPVGVLENGKVSAVE